jgi:hypothetical protein
VIETIKGNIIKQSDSLKAGSRAMIKQLSTTTGDGYKLMKMLAAFKDSIPAIFYDSEFIENRTLFEGTNRDMARYFLSFFPLDLVFPALYTLLFMSCLQVCTNPQLYKVLSVVIITGAVLDYLEDLSFATYLLGAGDGIATIVSYFTTLKTAFFITNIFMALMWILVRLKQIVFS